MAILIPRCVEVKLRGEIEILGSMLLHVFHCETPGVPTEADCTAIATAVAAWATADFSNAQVIALRINDVTATSKAEVNGPQNQQAIDVIGTRHDDPLPGGVSVAIKKSTGLAGRSNRGRFFAWPGGEGDQSAGIFQDGYVALQVGTYNQLKEALATAGYPLVVASPTHLNFQPVTSIVAVDHNADSQRRRNPGRGA